MNNSGFGLMFLIQNISIFVAEVQFDLICPSKQRTLERKETKNANKERYVLDNIFLLS